MLPRKVALLFTQRPQPFPRSQRTSGSPNTPNKPTKIPWPQRRTRVQLVKAGDRRIGGMVMKQNQTTPHFKSGPMAMSRGLAWPFMCFVSRAGTPYFKPKTNHTRADDLPVEASAGANSVLGALSLAMWRDTFKELLEVTPDRRCIYTAEALTAALNLCSIETHLRAQAAWMKETLYREKLGLLTPARRWVFPCPVLHRMFAHPIKQCRGLSNI